MAITKQTILDAITIRASGHVEIRVSVRVLDDDGVTILGERYQRRVIAPEDDISAESQRIQKICNIARGLQ
jgi:hypothetical protein